MRTPLTMTQLRLLATLRSQPRGFARMLCIALCFATLIAAATPLHAQARSAAEPARIDIAVTYAASHSTHTVVGETSGCRAERSSLARASSTGLASWPRAPASRSVARGQRWWRHSISSSSPLVPGIPSSPGRRISVFGEGFIGEALGFNSLFAYGSGPAASLSNGTTTSADSLAPADGRWRRSAAQSPFRCPRDPGGLPSHAAS